MSKRKKTAFPEDLWVVEYVDQMDWDGNFESEPMPREEAEKNMPS